MKLNGGFKLFSTITLTVVACHAILDFIIDKFGITLMQNVVLKSVLVIGVVFIALYTTCYRPLSNQLMRIRRLDGHTESMRMIFKYAGIVLWRTDENGIITLSEGDVLRKIGIEPGELVGVEAASLFVNTTNPDACRRALNGEHVVATSEFVEGVWFKNYYIPVKGHGIVGVSMDITKEITDKSNLTKLRRMIKGTQ